MAKSSKQKQFRSPGVVLVQQPSSIAPKAVDLPLFKMRAVDRVASLAPRSLGECKGISLPGGTAFKFFGIFTF